MKQIILTFVLFFALTTSGWCGLVVGFDPADLTVTSTGTNQIVDLGILIQHDGVGEDTLSAFTLDFSEASPFLEVVQGTGFASDFTWSISSGVEVNDTSISGSNISNHIIDTSGTQLLGTLQFTLDESFTNGTIPIELTFNSALRDIFTPIPASEVTVTGGTLTVVPEPGSLAMMGLAAAAGVTVGFRRRKRAIP